MLTSANLYNMNGLTKTQSGFRSRKSSDFFMPILRRMRTENILNIGQRLCALVESATCSNSSDITKHKGITMINSITTFNFNNNVVRTQLFNNNPYFCLTDACKALGLSEKTKSRTRLDEKGVRKTHTLTNGGQQELTFINEPNLYRLIFRSHIGQWNTNRDGEEVLPKPATKEQKFVHHCDYLASRKFITVEELD